jgi:hypothetical protein
MSNLDLWSRVEKTPVEHTKEITGKSYKGNSPKPHHLVHRATEVFGPCGIGWGFNVVDERIEEGAGGEKLHIARVKVWYEWGGKRGEVEHIGGTQFSGTRSNGKPFTDEDAPKKSVTDALVKALSMIGFAGDIFLGRYDDSKYLHDLRSEAQNAAAEEQANVRSEAMESLWSELTQLRSAEGLKSFWIDNSKAIAGFDDVNRARFTKKKDEMKARFDTDQTVADIQDTFPGAKVVDVRRIEDMSSLEAGE